MSELPGLVVDVEARITKLEQGLKKANVTQKRASHQMERRAQQSAARLSRTYERAGSNIATSFGKLGPALLAGISVSAINAATGRIRQIVGEVASIGDAAATAGVSVEAFQELVFVSEQNRISVDAMTDSLKELSLRADEFIVTGGGPAAEAFNRLGFRADELKRKLEDPPKLLEEIADRARDLDDAARIRIFDELLGGTGAEQLTRLLSGGGDALRNLRQQARDTGAVLDADVIQKAEELDRKFAALTTRMSNFGKSLAVGLADASVKIVTLRTDLADLTTTLERAQSLLGEETSLQLSTDQGALDEHKQTVEAIVAEYHRLAESADQLTGPLFQAASTLAMFGEADAAAEMNRIASEMNALIGDLNDGSISAETFEKRIQELATAAQTALSEISAIDGVQFAGVKSALGGFIEMMGAAVSRARELRAALPGANPEGIANPSAVDPDATDPRGNQLSPPPRIVPATGPTKSLRPQLPGIDSSFGFADAPVGGGGGGGSGLSSDYEREIASISEATAALHFEAQALAQVADARVGQADAMELARTKADLLAAAQRSGVEITPALRAEIDQLAGQYVQAGTSAEMAASKIQQVQDASRQGAQAIADVFMGMASGALSAKEAVTQLIAQIAQLIIKQKILAAVKALSGGPLGGVFGLIGGALFADGGYTGRGGKYEPAGVVHKGEYVMSKAATQTIGVGNLEALHSAAKRGYADGGLVGAKPSGKASAARSGASGEAPLNMTVNAPITVNGSAGTPSENSDLAKKMAFEMEQTMRGVIVDEMRKQTRPGNMMNNRRR